MKKALVITLIILTATLCSSTSSAFTVRIFDADESEIRKRVEQLADAFLRADADALDEMIAHDYIHTNASGSVVNKRDWLNYIRSRKAELASGKLKIETYRNSDLQIRLYGETAVVTGRNTTIGVRDGTQFNLNLRFTNVWIKRQGKWLRAAFHDSNLPTTQ